MRKIFLIALLFSVSLTASAQNVEIRQQVFEKVWSTVKEKHFDPSFGGVDWDKIHEQYAPRVASVKNNGELYDLLQQMLNELHQSHFSIIPPEAIIENDQKGPAEGNKGPAEGNIGIDLQIIDNQAVITRVGPESTAARAGLHTGFVIKKIGDTTVDQIIERFAKSKLSASVKRIYMSRSVLRLIDGEPQTQVRIGYLDEKDQQREVTVEREKFKGEMSQPFGNLPPVPIDFESKRLPGNIGYIRFNIFIPAMMDKIRPTIRSMKDAEGIIIDVRGNPGGVGVMANGIAGLLTEKQFTLGTMKLRTGFINFVAFPQPEPYLRPIVILIDGLSASTSEVFASGMQEEGRAVVVGERSAGAALPSVIEKLATGALFQYALADFKTPKG